VINGLVANEAPSGTTSQALLLFSLAYFVGVFGFPGWRARSSSTTAVGTLMLSVTIAALNWLITVARLIARRIAAPKIVQVS
jgi:hypothetical protein